MRTSGVVFEGKRYWSPKGVYATTPPDDLPDVSGFGNDGTFVQDTAWEQLPSGLWVMAVDGDDDNVTISDDLSLRIGTRDFTVHIWFNGDSTQLVASGKLFCKGHVGVGDWALRNYGSNSGIEFYANQARWALQAAAKMDGAWHFAAASRKDGDFYFFVDGTMSSTTDKSGIDLNSTLACYLGAYGSGTEFKGKLGLPYFSIGHGIDYDTMNAIYASQKGWFDE